MRSCGYSGVRIVIVEVVIDSTISVWRIKVAVASGGVFRVVLVVVVRVVLVLVLVVLFNSLLNKNLMSNRYMRSQF